MKNLGSMLVWHETGYLKRSVVFFVDLALLQAVHWRRVHPMLLDICLAFAPMRLPAYVLMWIIDWLPVDFQWIEPDLHSYVTNQSHLHLVPQIKKIRLIEGVYRSIRSVQK